MKRQHLLLSVILASATLSYGQDQNRGLVLEASGSLGLSKLVPAKVDLINKSII